MHKATILCESVDNWMLRMTALMNLDPPRPPLQWIHIYYIPALGVVCMQQRTVGTKQMSIMATSCHAVLPMHNNNCYLITWQWLVYHLHTITCVMGGVNTLQCAVIDYAPKYFAIVPVQ